MIPNNKIQNGLWMLAFNKDSKIFKNIKQQYKLNINWNICNCGGEIQLKKKVKSKTIYKCNKCFQQL